MRIAYLTLATDKYETRAISDEAAMVDDEVVDMDGEPMGHESVEITHPVVVDLDWVAYFHPRRKSRSGQERVGTRLVLKNGSAVAVAETCDAIASLLAG